MFEEGGAFQPVSVPAGVTAGVVEVTAATGLAVITGGLTASRRGRAVASFAATTFTSAAAEVRDAGGAVVGGVNGIALELTATGGELFATPFTATATARGAADVAVTANGSLAVRREFVSVATVVATPPFGDPGTAFAVSVRLLNAVNRPQTVTVQYVVKDAAGATVFASGPRPSRSTPARRW